MLLQTSLAHQLRNIYTVAAIHDRGKGISSQRELADGYRQFISRSYRRSPPLLNSCAPLSARVITDPSQCETLSKVFLENGPSLLDDLDQLTAISLNPVDTDQSRKSSQILSALNLLRGFLTDYETIAELLITDIVILPSSIANGGSTSDGLGIVWANPERNWRTLDSVEFIVHELTHQCMFVDEICERHYNYKLLLKKSNWAQSAILRKLRPVDKVLHSIVVATELILFRELTGHPATARAHPPTSKLIDQSRAAIKSLRDVIDRCPDLLTARALDILENCDNLITKTSQSLQLET